MGGRASLDFARDEREGSELWQSTEGLRPSTPLGVNGVDGVVRAGALAAFCFVCAWGCTSKDVRPSSAPSHAKLFVTAEVKGYLGPCGCSENMRGGIARTAFQVAQARQGSGVVFFIDSGDALFGQEQLPVEAVLQQERKA